MNNSEVIIIGYSGHSYVIIDIFKSRNSHLKYYIDNEEKSYNPYNLQYLGTEKEKDVQKELKINDYFIAIGTPVNAIHHTSLLSSSVKLGKGVMCAPNITINAWSKVGNGVICNTGCIIEHECKIEAYAHIAPGVVLAGNVTIGKYSFIGANSVIKQGITIGKNVIVGAGSVVIKDIPDNVIVVGNPARIIKQNL